MTSIKDRIIGFDRSVPASEVADELDTTESYVYKVRSNARRTDPPERDPVQTDETGAETDSFDFDTPETETTETGAESPLADLVIEDSYDEYECGECQATVEYLEDECPSCSVELAWWSE